jgi:hypothetical protein
VNIKSGNTPQISGNHILRLQLGLAFLSQLFGGNRVHAENQVEYGYEYYSEENDRMTIQTHNVAFEQKLTDVFDLKGELTYDGISGSTPTGTLSPAGKVNFTQLEDIRRAVSLQLDSKVGNHTITPGFAYSGESDYTSYGVSVNDAITFNEKNTTLQLGVSENIDSVREANKTTWNPKYGVTALVGVSQLLSPTTIFTVDFTFGNDSGYLSDPYRLANFLPYDSGGNPFPFTIGVPERRPSHRNKEILYTSLLHYFDAVNGSLETSYRFYNDSYGVYANTLSLTWHQWLGKHLLVDPYFRFYEQSAADFYHVTFSGLFSTDPPGFHSSDYRLSELYTLDAGLQATVIITEYFHIIAGYHRYEMHGLDGKTSTAMYPKANVYTVGLSFLW